MDTSWDDLRSFLAAARAGSMSAGAAELGVAQATMSRRIAQLEATLGHVLFDRTRDGLVLTSAAEALLPHVETMAHAHRLCLAAASGLEARPEGVVRLAIPPGTAVDVAPTLAAGLAERYPGLRLEVLSDNSARDLMRHEADLAVRSMKPERGDLVYRRLGASRLGVYAAPALLARLGKDATLEDLPWVQWSSELAHIPMATWVAERLGARPPAFSSNSFLAMRAAAAAGLGAMLMPGMQAHVVGMVEVPYPTPPLPELPFYLVAHRALRHVPRVAAVMDYIEEVVGASDGFSRWPPPQG
ncbi:MAG: LysR family transcriptional regulator [Alphaproteobacteria bacterium]|nr:LysR family transcriptional regulator [Alphaproteobacteria bacterium]